MEQGAGGYEAFVVARERRGRLLVSVIVGLNGALTVLGFGASLAAGVAGLGSLLVTPFWLVVYLMLYLGQRWAKWLFIGASALSGVRLIAALSQIPASVLQEVEPGALLFAAAVSILGVAVMVASSLVLLFSASVSEFLYGQEAG